MRIHKSQGFYPLFPVIVAGAFGVTCGQEFSHTKSPPVSVERFEEELPIGYLGVSLGKIVRVTGLAVDGNATMRKADSGKILLRIDTVNGKAIESPIDFEFLRAPQDVRKPVPGERFDYYVHEYGHFDGVVTAPIELGIKEPPIAHDGFYYRRRIAIHASNAIHK